MKGLNVHQGKFSLNTRQVKFQSLFSLGRDSAGEWVVSPSWVRYQKLCFLSLLEDAINAIPN